MADIVDMALSATTYAELLAQAAERSPDDEVLVFPDVRVTYAELADGARRRAGELRALGVAPGDRVGVIMPNAPTIIELLGAAALVGAILVPINTRFKSFELAHVIDNAQLKVLYTTDAIDEHVNFKVLLQEALPALSEAPDPARLSLEQAPWLTAIVVLGRSTSPGFLDEETLGATIRR